MKLKFAVLALALAWFGRDGVRAEEKEPTVAELKAELAKAKMEAQACEVKLDLWHNVAARAWIGDMEKGALERWAAQNKAAGQPAQ